MEPRQPFHKWVQNRRKQLQQQSAQQDDYSRQSCVDRVNAAFGTDLSMWSWRMWEDRLDRDVSDEKINMISVGLQIPVEEVQMAARVALVQMPADVYALYAGLSEEQQQEIHSLIRTLSLRKMAT